MNGYDHICQRQRMWAKGCSGIQLDPKRPQHDLRQYTSRLGENLFQPLNQATLNEFKNADGNELTTKMRALHSSSAVCVNVFDYWRSQADLTPIAQACRRSPHGLTQLRFEQKLTIDNSFARAPNIDLLMEYTGRKDLQAVGVESKFGEPYGGSHTGMSAKYLKLPALWRGWTHTEQLAQEISPKDGRFRRLHAAQLIKHALGLRKTYGRSGFVLLYLWTDAPCQAADVHRAEIADFASVVQQDNIRFRAITYQEVISRLLKDPAMRQPSHADYLAYISARYL